MLYLLGKRRLTSGSQASADAAIRKALPGSVLRAVVVLVCLTLRCHCGRQTLDMLPVEGGGRPLLGRAYILCSRQTFFLPSVTRNSLWRLSMRRLALHWRYVALHVIAGCWLWLWSQVLFASCGTCAASPKELGAWRERSYLSIHKFEDLVLEALPTGIAAYSIGTEANTFGCYTLRLRPVLWSLRPRVRRLFISPLVDRLIATSGSLSPG